MQTWSLEEAVAVARLNTHLENAALTIDQQRHVDAGVAQRPDLTEQGGEVLDLRAGNREHHIAGVQVGTLRWAAARHADNHDPVLDLAGIEAEPRPRRAIPPPIREEIVKDRVQEIDRHDHVEMLGRSILARPFELQRPDAEKV